MHDDGLIIHQLKVACTNRNLPKSLRQWLMLIGNQLDNIFGAQMLKPAWRSSRFSMESSRPEATSGKGTGGEGGEERGATEQRNCWFVFGIHLSESKQTRCIGLQKIHIPLKSIFGMVPNCTRKRESRLLFRKLSLLHDECQSDCRSYRTPQMR